MAHRCTPFLSIIDYDGNKLRAARKISAIKVDVLSVDCIYAFTLLHTLVKLYFNTQQFYNLSFRSSCIGVYCDILLVCLSISQKHGKRKIFKLVFFSIVCIKNRAFVHVKEH